MSHAITALLIPGPCSPPSELVPIPLSGGMTLVNIDHYFTAYQQAVTGTRGFLPVPPDYPPTFPREAVILTLAKTFALVMTDYFGGAGSQWAIACTDGVPVPGIRTINEALRSVGVTASPGLDEFDTVGLGSHRHQPDHLDRYADLCDALGV